MLEDVGAKSLKYLYDFGDGWERSVRIERITDAIRASPIRASTTPPDAAHLRMSAARSATTTSSKPSQIRITSSMPRA